jgi:heme-degrading monooxygenase HmoA
MIAKIFIKRKFSRDNTSEIVPLLMQMRAGAMKQSGYISGETLTSTTDPQNIAVIATWQSMEDWIKWRENPERQKIEAMLEVFQLGPTVYEEYFLGSTFK